MTQLAYLCEVGSMLSLCVRRENSATGRAGEVNAGDTVGTAGAMLRWKVWERIPSCPSSTN